MATKRPFRTPIDAPKKITTVSGTETIDKWAMKLDDKGNQEFYISGKTNIYEKTQAFLEETKLENIIAKCIDTGDMSYLEQVKGSYYDAVGMPKDLFEAHQKIMEAENTFNNLPKEIREKYDFNFNKYLADIGSDEWLKNMNLNIKETTEPIKEPEKEETVNE